MTRSDNNASSPRPTIILLSGNMCDVRMWQGTIPALGQYHIACPVLTEDTIDGMAQQILDYHKGPIIPIGFSMGGIVALALARLAPERIAAIALLGTNPTADLPDRAAKRPGHQDMVHNGGLKSLVTDALLPIYFAPENADNDILRSTIVQMAMDLGDDIFVQQSEALRTRIDQSDIMAKISAPSFIACGAEDIICPPAWHEKMAAQARQGELHIIPNAGHLMPMEQPEILSGHLSQWLDKITLKAKLGANA